MGFKTMHLIWFLSASAQSAHTNHQPCSFWISGVKSAWVFSESLSLRGRQSIIRAIKRTRSPNRARLRLIPVTSIPWHVRTHCASLNQVFLLSTLGMMTLLPAPQSTGSGFRACSPSTHAIRMRWRDPPWRNTNSLACLRLIRLQMAQPTSRLGHLR